MHETAQKHLFKHLLKTKRIAESSIFQQFKQFRESSTNGNDIRGPRDVAEANVIARLFKSNPVKNVVPKVVADIRNLLRVDQDRSRGYEEIKKEEKEIRYPDPGGKKAAEETEEDEDEEEEDAEEMVAKSNSNSGSVDNTEDQDERFRAGADTYSESADYAQFDSRIAASSSSENEDEAAEEVEGHTHRQPSPPLKKSKSKEKGPPKSTTFLPSLMMGGYWSGSESDGQEEEEDGVGGKPGRKNRMGQQARRALWEKKYGARANHLQKQAKGKNKKKGKNADLVDSRDSGWDMRKGATEPDEDARARRGVGQRRGTKQRDQNAGPIMRSDNLGSKKDNNKALHPSWEAAKRAKEQGADVSFQGKKITFD